jgi:hypothetical protein
MMHVIGLRRLAGYSCHSYSCVGVEYTIEDLTDAERYRIVTEDLLARKRKRDEMRQRNGWIDGMTISDADRRGLQFCLTCGGGYHPPTAEHPLCSYDGGVHAPFPSDAYFDFKGWRFKPPFHCMCCGKEICYQQWAYGRSCGTCDTGACTREQLHHHFNGTFCGPNTELVDPVEAAKYNMKMTPIPPAKPLEWRERKPPHLRPKPWTAG